MVDDVRFGKYEPHLLYPSVSLFVAAFNGPPWDERWTEERAATWLKQVAAAPNFRGYCCLRAGHLVAAALGILKMCWHGEEYYIEEMFVAAEEQRRGLGSRLLQHIEEDLKKNHIATITLLTDRGKTARRFYEKSGFYCVEDVVTMKKKL